MASSNRKWTQEEDQILLRYIKANPQNLHKCFLMVSEHLTDKGTPRTPQGVQAHWYTSLSKKNGAGVESNPGIWRRLITVLRSLTH